MAKFLQNLGAGAGVIGTAFGIPGMEGFVNGLTGTHSAEEQAQLNANEDNVAFTRETNAQAIELANTAHQREVADLKAAGLNPILSAGGSGSYTPGLSVPHEDSLAPIMQNSAKISNDRAQVGLNAQQTASNIRLQNTQSQVNTAQVAKTIAETENQRSQSQLNSANAAKINAENPGIKEEYKLREWEAKDRQSRPNWLKRVGQGWKDFGDTTFAPISGLLKALIK